MRLAVDRVVAAVGTELPAFVAHHRLDDIHRDHVLKSLELAEHDRAVRPRAGERDIEVIAPARGRKAAGAARTRAAVRRHPVAEFRLAALEAPAGRLGVVETGVPDTVDHLAMGHENSAVILRWPRSGLEGGPQAPGNTPSPFEASKCSTSR
jgi:hypothetical protein